MSLLKSRVSSHSYSSVAATDTEDLSINLPQLQVCRQPCHGHDEEAGKCDEDNAEWEVIRLKCRVSPQIHKLPIDYTLTTFVIHTVNLIN